MPRENPGGKADRISSAAQGTRRAGAELENSESPSKCPEKILVAKQTGFPLPPKVLGGRERNWNMNEVLRQEKKYLLNMVDAQKLCARLSQVMELDQHNGANGYRIRSLYFDRINDGDFMDKVDGMEQRRKIRLRNYGAEEAFAMLEMKQKEGAYQKKRSLPVKRKDAAALSQGNYTPLLAYGDSFAAECYCLMNTMCYRPRAVVEYRRRAFVAKENRIRVTIDDSITATEACYDIFSPTLCQYPVMDAFQGVLEVKYNGFLPGYIKELVSGANRSEFSVSKYCLARSVGLHYQM